MMPSKRLNHLTVPEGVQARPFSLWHFLLPLVGLMILALAALLVTSYRSSSYIDALDQKRELHQIHEAIRNFKTKQKEDIVSVSTWDDAVINLHLKPNRSWFDLNSGIWFQTFYGHHLTFVLNGRDQPVLATLYAQPVQPAHIQSAFRILQPFVARLRTLPVGDGTAVSGIATIFGSPAIVAAAKIVPDHDKALLQRTESILVSVYFMDAVALQAIENSAMVKRMEIGRARVDEPGFVKVKLIDFLGKPAGELSWKTAALGTMFLKELLPSILIAAFLLCGATAIVIWYVVRSTRQIQHSDEHSRFLAFHDPLTGLPNRSFFNEELRQRLLQRKNDDHWISILYMDLDGFKGVNDSWGHAAGDALLQIIAERLHSCVRPHDLIARLGGDEFAILQSGQGSPDDIEPVCARILNSLGKPIMLNGVLVDVGASIGVAVAPYDGDSADLLMRRADLAMYMAKTEGGRQAAFFAEALETKLNSHRVLSQELRVALDAQELTIVYQPVAEIATGRITGVEALVRWKHKRLGTIPPADFIPIAEASGLINALSLWVLREGCRAVKQWGQLQLAVNLSPALFRQASLVESLELILTEEAFDPHRLVVEVTEGILLQPEFRAEEALTKLKSIGVQVALDDFGTGYSSLSYLQRFAFDKIKIDRSFVSQILDNPKTVSIVQAVIAIAADFKADVVAEGVETAEQLAALQVVGCQQWQGYLLCTPLPAHDLEEIMLAEQPLIMLPG